MNSGAKMSLKALASTICRALPASCGAPGRTDFVPSLFRRVDSNQQRLFDRLFCTNLVRESPFKAKNTTIEHTNTVLSQVNSNTPISKSNSNRMMIRFQSTSPATVAAPATAAASSTAIPPVTAAHDQSVHQPFPSIVIGPERSIEPQGSFAEAQAQVRIKATIAKNGLQFVTWKYLDHPKAVESLFCNQIYSYCFCYLFFHLLLMM